MPRAEFNNVAIRGVAAAVPEHRVDNAADHAFMSTDAQEKVVSLTGVSEYRQADDATCASDLCEQAARQLMDGLKVSAEEFDGLIFVTMTPDYRIPSTACLLQNRLGCRTSIVAFDINMGCSGYVVGLFNVCSLMQGAGLRKVLLLTGDTQTKLCYQNDKNVAFILADGGTATILERDSSASPITVELHTDGSRFRNLYVPAGGFRNMSDDVSREVRLRSDGAVRADDHLFMNGMEIFKFASTDVVAALSGFMKDQDLTPADVDHLLLHQANKFMNDKVARKLGFPPEKVPYSIARYGNTGSASIPLTIAHHFSQFEKPASGRQLLCGFGVGLSWGMVDVHFDDVFVPPIEDYRSKSGRRSRTVQTRNIFLFPGQGAQAVGMGKELYDKHAFVRDLFARASDTLGMDLKTLCFEGPEEVLRQTDNVQPALTLVSIACLEALKRDGYEPVAVAGHSLGEFSALYAAGAINFEDTMKIVRHRGRAMQKASRTMPGGMVAVLGLTPEKVKEICADAGGSFPVQLANFNSPTQTILSGGTNEIAAVSDVARKAGAVAVVPLNVSGAWHSKAMQPASKELELTLRDIQIADPKIPVAANFSGNFYQDADEIRRMLVEQVVSPVDWLGCMATLTEFAPAAQFIEVGTGSTLKGLLRDFDKSVSVWSFDEYLREARAAVG